MKKPENSNDEFANNVFNNMMDLFFKPEIKKRTEQGLLSEDFQLLAAQAIIYPDGRQPIIKLNAEVSAEVKIKKNDNKEVENFWPSTEQIEYIKLRDEEFLNCGHVTIILFNNGFHISFDFQYNKKISTTHLKVAEQFIKTSKFALENNYFETFIDNSFSAVELLAKTNLLLEANPKVQGKTFHKTIHSAFNQRFKNSDSEFEIDRRKTLNSLSSARNSARYLEGEINFNKQELYKIYETIEHMYLDLSNRVSYNVD